jgi:type III pantothenate kinase
MSNAHGVLGSEGVAGWDDLRWLAVAVGNTRVRVGRMIAGVLDRAESVTTADTAGVTAAIARAVTEGEPPQLAVVASVNPRIADAVRGALVDRLGGDRVLMIGREIPLPLRHAMDDASTLGIDRALAALAAYERSQQAAVVVDVGTAVTVDFIDGEGVFHGGAILPGLSMMLKALHDHTASLPAAKFEMPAADRGPFGLDTQHAMRLGAVAAVRGALRELLDRYAEHYQAYPQVVGTGGDIGVLEATDLVEHVVPDLQLMGIAAATRAALFGTDDRDVAGDDAP